jgi:isopenicillin N synthase-like dioxygenase
VCNRSAGARQQPDPREAFSIRKWVDAAAAEAAALPPVLSEKRRMIKSFQEELHSFALELLECIATALGLPKTQFASQHNRGRPNFDNFELMHYPALPPQAAEEIPRHRISPHTDWGSITLLFQQDIGGLQIRPPHYASPAPSADEVWTDAPVFNDNVLVNIGDMMEFWTAGKLKSTWQRVTSRPVRNPQHGRTDRYCFAYFLHPDKDAVLVPIEGLRPDRDWRSKYEGTGRSAEEHIMARINGVHGPRTEWAKRSGAASTEETH